MVSKVIAWVDMLPVGLSIIYLFIYFFKLSQVDPFFSLCESLQSVQWGGKFTNAEQEGRLLLFIAYYLAMLFLPEYSSLHLSFPSSYSGALLWMTVFGPGEIKKKRGGG